MAMKQLMLYNWSPLDLDKYLWVLKSGTGPYGVQMSRKSPVLIRRRLNMFFQKLLICGFIVVWGDVLPKGMWSHKERPIERVFFASEVITSKTISQCSSGAGWHSLILSLGLSLHLRIVQWCICCQVLEGAATMWKPLVRAEYPNGWKGGSSNRSDYLERWNARAKIQISTLYESL